MKDILMITHFTTFPWEMGNGRFVYLADMLCKHDFSVEMVTTTFFHKAKAQRQLNDVDLASVPYNVKLLNEPGYKKNVSIKRLRSHKKFGRNLAKYLEQRNKPDVVYCSVPSLDAAMVAAKYCKKNGVRFIIDIQDLWPEAFKMAFHVPILSNMLFAPLTRKANKIYASADEIIAVSQTYAQRAMRVNKSVQAHVVYLGTDKDYFDECARREMCLCPNNAIKDLITDLANRNTNADEKIYIAYAGTLGNSYDLEVVFNALRQIDSNALARIEFVVMGDGPRRAEFEEKAKNLPVIFTGSLAYSDMVWVLSRCDIAVNPIVKGSAGSIINKHMDYAMAGLPVINTQESPEYRDLIEKYECGINCGCGSVVDVANAIMELCNDRDKIIEMGQCSRKMGEELFDRKLSYNNIVTMIESICRE